VITPAVVCSVSSDVSALLTDNQLLKRKPRLHLFHPLFTCIPLARLPEKGSEKLVSCSSPARGGQVTCTEPHSFLLPPAFYLYGERSNLTAAVHYMECKLPN
jgi:hypothetical protein